MKPHPGSILAATTALRVEPSACVLIGDSVADIVAAGAAGVPAIGYANRPGKGEELVAVGAVGVVTNMADIASCLLECRN